ncbi:hypothetical protein [Tsukamurella pseudospumae]|nr:hypothetical protein [Tsukamurella pseudospumae]
MSTPSLLGASAAAPDRAPDHFADLGLDRIVREVAAQDPAIAPLFRAPAPTSAAARYRQDLCRALRRDADLGAGVRRFCAGMATMRAARSNAERLRLRPERDAWFLDGARLYLTAVAGLRSTLAAVVDAPAAVRDLRGHLDALAKSPGHRALSDDAEDAAAQMDGVEYTVRIKKSDVRVGRYHGEPDYGTEVAAVFARFRVDGSTRRAEDVPVRPGLDGAEAAVLGAVTALYPDAFEALARFRARHDEYGDPTVIRADLEIRWYLGYLDFVG